MKTLLVVRHAKSSWDSPSLKDFDRPLNNRGNKDAPQMAQKLLQRKLKVDALVSSPANRALSTAMYFGTILGIKEKDIVQVPELYHAPAEVFYSVIGNSLKNKWDTVAIFSHNPGITSFVNDLDVARLDNMPTCGVFGVTADIEDWKDFQTSSKRFLLFDYPKNPG